MLSDKHAGQDAIDASQGEGGSTLSPVAVLAPLTLAACGGGGGSSGGSVAAAPPPTSAAPAPAPMPAGTPTPSPAPPAPSPPPTPTPDPAPGPTPVSPSPVVPVLPALPVPSPSPSPPPAPSGPGGSTPTPPPAPVSNAQAARFLAQAAMGSSQADIADVRAQGYAGWLDAQFARPRGTKLWDWLVANGYNVVANRDGTTGFDPAMWRLLIAEPDQLRTRVGLALLEIFVVGIDGINLSWRQFAMAAYVDTLLDQAFGNFRGLMEKVSLNPAMGSFLTFLNNRKANPATGSQPDENYARELLQLFTIGLRQLEMDGSEKLANGKPVETYAAADVSGLARVFTGFVLDSNDNETPDRMGRALAFNAGMHETGVGSFLGTTVPAGTSAANALKQALDTIFAHPNVPPFIARQLIQRLVTSNPSPAYVARAAGVFANNGQGVRGDLKATVRAILLDPEARAEPSNSGFGKLREPALRLTAWARAFGATSPSNAWPIGDTSNPANRLAQTMGRSPSVFNWFRPGYVPPGTAMAAQGWVAPEFQVTNEVSVVGYVNYMQALIQGGMGDFKADYAAWLPKAADPAALVAEINLLLAADQLSAATVGIIVGAVASIPASNAAARVHTAILLVMASPEYITLR